MPPALLVRLPVGRTAFSRLFIGFCRSNKGPLARLAAALLRKDSTLTCCVYGPKSRVSAHNI